MTTPELPEPLRTAVNGAGDLMARGSAGTSSKGGAPQSYRRLAEQHRGSVVAAIRARVEQQSPGRTVREADEGLYQRRPDRSVLFRLVVCDSSRPDRKVTIFRSTDWLYTVTAPRGDGPGLVVGLVAAKGAVAPM